ncbi:MAG: hypothetical protein NC820_07585, partial [Candidatus Omnitrophica bacterium]|nr:hypothetical protein [Candidatus Omnitrophota bacterium]
MNIYSQKDKRWADKEVVKGLKMRDFGCLITALACLDGRTPDKILDILKKNQAITADGKVIWNKSADILGLTFEGFDTKPSEKTCIAETDHYYKIYKVNHFFVWLNDGNIIDPLDGRMKKNLYNIVRYIKIYPE